MENISLTYIVIGSMAFIFALGFLASKLFAHQKPLDKSRVTQNFMRVYPDSTISDIILSCDEKAAIVLLSDNTVGQAYILGDRVVVKNNCERPKVANKDHLTFIPTSIGEAPHSFVFSADAVDALRQKGMIHA